jgi:starch synthase
MTKVLMVASEATPFAKTGGLAEVIGSLAPSLRALGEDVAVFLPRYRSTGLQGLTRAFDDLQIWLGSDSYPVSLYQATDRGVPYYFMDSPALFDRDGLYGDSSGDYPDNYLRFAVFSRAALELVRRVFRPQVIHCHDWQAALAPVYLRTLAASDPTFLGMKTVFTIHNLGYQGLFDRAILPKIGLDAALFRPDGLEYFGKVGFLKGGLLYSDALTTVSRKYAEEIQTPELGFGLDGVLRSRAGALTGILNGVDYAQWDPRTDSLLAARYSADNLLAKRTCKADLLDTCSLSRENLERPLIGIVSRFAGQKGFELIEEIASELLAEDLSLVALGTGDPRTERFFTGLAEAQPDRIAVRIGYDNALAHKIEAGADIFLMPSLYEPSGLNQMYSLRYGTVPVVRATGGLDDTVDDETGFKFQEYSGAALLAALRAALAAYKQPFLWTEIMRAGMRKDYSWQASASEYSALYRRLAG